MRIGGEEAWKESNNRSRWHDSFFKKFCGVFDFPAVSQTQQTQKSFYVFPLVFIPPVPVFGYQDWKDAGENVQTFRAPGREPSRESKIRAKGLPKAPRPASQRGYTRRLLLLMLFWCNWLAESVGEGGNKAIGRRRGVWWKEQKPWCLPDSGQIPVSSLTSSGLFSPL